MDSLTHLAMGHAMGVFASGATPAATTAAYWGAFIGNSLPDIDVTVGHLLGKGWSLHRKFTHTVGGMLFLSALATGAITWAVPGSDLWLTFAWTLAGCIIHVFMDCLNAFGVRPLAPFSHRTFGFGVLFLVDPVILGALGLGSVAHVSGLMGAGVLQTLYLAMWVYIAFRWLMLPVLKKKVSKEPGVSQATVTGWWLGWRFLRLRDGQLELGSLSLVGRRITVLHSVAPAMGPAVDASRQAPQVVAFLERATYPYARLEEKDGLYHIAWEDFAGHLRRGGPIPLTVRINRDLQIVEQA